MPELSAILPCLWFDDKAEAAANFYVGIFPNSRINAVTRYPAAGKEIHGRAEGSVMTVEFELNGMQFSALNGGPLFTFTEAVSFQVMCADQEEIDHYWNALGAGGDPRARQCGWVKDKFGLSWQVVPRRMTDYITSTDAGIRERAMAAMMTMKKLDIAELERAAKGVA